VQDKILGHKRHLIKEADDTPTRSRFRVVGTIVFGFGCGTGRIIRRHLIGIIAAWLRRRGAAPK
jgi:hypothetical protein